MRVERTTSPPSWFKPYVPVAMHGPYGYCCRARLLAKSKPTEDEENDYDQTDDINDVVHGAVPLRHGRQHEAWQGVCHRLATSNIH